MPTLLLARHGQASYGTDNYDLLSVRGHEQVDLLRAELQRQGQTLGRVAAGAMRRQQQTASPIAAAAGLVLATDARLDEFDADDVLGAYSQSSARPGGTTTVSATAFQDVLDPALQRWMAAGTDAVTAETWRDFSDRAMGSLAAVASSLERGTTGLVATSGGVIAAACVRLLDVPDETFVSFNRVIANASLTKVVVGRRGMSLISFNEHAYLETAGRTLVTYR